MMDNAEDFIFFKNENHVITGASQTLASICPSAQHWTDLIGQTDYDIFTEEYADKFYRLEKQIYSGMPFVSEDQEYIKANGELGWVSNCKYPIRNDGGKIIGLFGIARDITERKMIEDALRKSEARLTLAQRIAHVGNWELDLASNRLWWSDEIFRIFEVDSSSFDVSYEAFIAVIHPDDREMVNSAYLNSLQNKTPYDIEHRLLLQDGRIKYVHERCETVYGSAGEPLRSVGTVQDVSDRKRLKLEGTDMLRRIESLIMQMDERTAAVVPQGNVVANSDVGAGKLSRRHLDVIELIAAGLTSAQIAVRLNISQTTVITHRRNLMRKLGLHSTAELTAYAIKNKIVNG
jgi:PAS domain S-box-containing protein